MHCARCGQEGDWLDQCSSHRGDTEAYYGYKPGELCKGCHRDLVTDPDVFDPDLRHFTFDFFYSASASYSRTMLEQHEATHVLVSSRTKHNGRIGTEDVHFVDSGGDPQAFTTDEFIDANGYPTPHESYLDYVEETTAGSQDYWALRDYPCANTVLNKYDATVADFQRRSVEAHRELLDLARERDINAQPVAVLQGNTLGEYLRHANMLSNADALTDYVAIGSIAPYGPETQQQIILTIRMALPERIRLHGLGVNLAALREPGVLDALDSADTGNWYSRAGDTQETAWSWTSDNALDFSRATYQYLDHRKNLNELLIEHDWDLDAPRESADEGSLASFTESTDTSLDSKVSPGPHLTAENRRLAINFSFDGMEASTNMQAADQNALTDFEGPSPTPAGEDTQAAAEVPEDADTDSTPAPEGDATLASFA